MSILNNFVFFSFIDIIYNTKTVFHTEKNQFKYGNFGFKDSQKTFFYRNQS